MIFRRPVIAPSLLARLAGVLLAGAATAAAADPGELRGSWTGTYLCKSGPMGANIEITRAEPDEIYGVLHFYPQKGNLLRGREGCHTITGSYNAADRELQLEGKTWLIRPQGWTMSPLRLSLSQDGSKLTGNLNPDRCRFIRLERAQPERPRPFHCTFDHHTTIKLTPGDPSDTAPPAGGQAGARQPGSGESKTTGGSDSADAPRGTGGQAVADRRAGEPAPRNNDAPTDGAPQGAASERTQPPSASAGDASGADSGAATPTPDDPRAAQLARGGSLQVKVRFPLDQWSLTDEAERTLDDLGALLTQPRFAGKRFEIIGHTDSSGAASDNQLLSQRRARTVAAYLSARFGIPRDRLVAVGRGESAPLDPDTPRAARNRRVEIRLIP